MITLKFQRKPQLCRVNAVVFYGISIARDFAMLQPGNRAVHGNLHIFRQGRGHPLNIHFFRIFTLRLHKKLVTFLIGKTHHLVLYGRAIARPCAFNQPAEQRRAVEVVAYDLMGFFVGIGQPAERLRAGNFLRRMCEGKGDDIVIARLRLHFCEVK